jgi:hypothetical protein
MKKRSGTEIGGACWVSSAMVFTGYS